MSETSTSPTSTDLPAGKPAGAATPVWKRLVPRSVFGVVTTIVALSVGASLSGVALYSYYEYRLTENENRVDNYINGFDDRFRTATETIDAAEQNAQASIQEELGPLRQFQAEGGTLASLVQRVGPSVWFVETLDESGAPSVGSAFVVESTENESVLVTSFETVRATTRAPGPPITIRKGDDRLGGRLDNWVEDKDLAAITIPRGNLPKLEWVGQDQQPAIGDRTFAASGLGSAGASVTQGFVSDVASGAITHSAPVGVAFRGGPLLNSDGRVAGIASTAYAPFGFVSPSGVSFANPVRVSCERLLRCPEGANEGGAAAGR